MAPATARHPLRSKLPKTDLCVATTSRPDASWRNHCACADVSLSSGKVKATGHAWRDMVVVGASAGGVEALSNLLSDLPSEIPIAFFVVLHVPPRSQSRLPLILERTSRLPAEHPSDGEKIRPGRIYVAPPDFHLMVGNGVIHLSRDPKQHHVRPAIDPLFRSAAHVYGERVVGVLLSGFLDDGVEGLREIKRCGGLAFVQAPAEARFPDMPQHAQAKINVDHCAPVAQLRELITRLPDQTLVSDFSLTESQPQSPAITVASEGGTGGKVTTNR